MTVPLVRTPKDMDELNAMLPDMRGSQADLARVAIMAQAIGYRQGVHDVCHNIACDFAGNPEDKV